MKLRDKSWENNKAKYIVVFLLVGVIALCAVWWVNRPYAGVKSDTYQLVKLTTGETYFGRIAGMSGGFVQLEKVYFISGDENQKANTNEVTLLSNKATVEKAEDPMFIAEDKVAYWENLSKDSKITQTIQKDGSKE